MRISLMPFWSSVLAPGTKLNEESLGEIFGVSRTIVRRLYPVWGMNR